jgi:hypothetical protein
MNKGRFKMWIAAVTSPIALALLLGSLTPETKPLALNNAREGGTLVGYNEGPVSETNVIEADRVKYLDDGRAVVRPLTPEEAKALKAEVEQFKKQMASMRDALKLEQIHELGSRKSPL